MNDATYLEGREKVKVSTSHPRIVILTEIFIRALLTTTRHDEGAHGAGQAPAIVYVMSGHVGFQRGERGSWLAEDCECACMRCNTTPELEPELCLEPEPEPEPEPPK